MTAKTYLRQAIKLGKLIRVKQMELRQLETMLTTIRAIDYQTERVQGGRSIMEDAIHELVALKNDIARKILAYAFVRRDIASVIELLPCDQQTILSRRYLLGQKWHTISQAIPYENSTLYRLQGDALRQIDEWINKYGTSTNLGVNESTKCDIL